MSIHRSDLPLSREHGVRDGYFRASRCRRCGIVVGYGDRCDFCIGRPSDHVDRAGDYVGRHHTEWIATVDELISQGDDDGAEFLLWKLIDAVEAEVHLTGVAPFERHFTRLEQLARRRGDEALATRVEERYERCRTVVLEPPSAAAS